MKVLCAFVERVQHLTETKFENRVCRTGASEICAKLGLFHFSIPVSRESGHSSDHADAGLKIRAFNWTPAVAEIKDKRLNRTALVKEWDVHIPIRKASGVVRRPTRTQPDRRRPAF
jgi:hypothetical protein